MEYKTLQEIKELQKIRYYKPRIRKWVVMICVLLQIVNVLTPFTATFLLPLTLKIWRYR